MPDNQQKLFNRYFSTSFSETNELEIDLSKIKKIAANYEWNYKKYLPADKNCRILDLGCGLGQFLFWLESKGYHNYLGVDISRQMLDLCQKNITGKVEKINSIAEFLADKNESYDLIVLNDVIEHLPKPEIIADLELIRAALKPNGQLIIKTNNLAAITGARLRYEDFTHELGFTEHSLRQALMIAGFRAVEIKAFDMPRTSLFRWIRFIGQAILHQSWRLIFFLEYTIVPKNVNELIFSVAQK